MSQSGVINIAGGGGGGSPILTLTGNSGGPISPTSNNINTVGTGSITVVGAGDTLTHQLTGLTNNAIQVGAGTATLTQLVPGNNGILISSATGVPSFLANGTTGQVLTATTGSPPSWASPSSAGVIFTRFTASGTWTINANTKYVTIYGWSGGGGGGSGRKGASGDR